MWSVGEIYLHQMLNHLSIGRLTSQQIFKINVLQCIDVSTFQNHRGRNACIKGFFPAQSTQAPAVAGHQARKTKFRSWGRKIITALFGKQQKLFRHFCADDMGSAIRFICMAAAIPEVPCHRVRRTGFEWCSSNVDSHSGVFFS
jgi:hypothetical protein